MKRLITSMVLGFCLVVSSFAANINDLNGFDWRAWNDTQRVSFVVGFISANNMVLEYMFFQSRNNNWDQSEKDTFRKTMEDQFGYEVNVVDVCKKVDEFYDVYDNRTFKVWQIILFAYGKDFWNAGSSKSKTSGSGA